MFAAISFPGEYQSLAMIKFPYQVGSIMKLCHLVSTNALHESHSQSSSQGTLAQVETDGANVLSFYLATASISDYLTTSLCNSSTSTSCITSPQPCCLGTRRLCSKPRDPFIKEQVSALNSGQILPYALYPGFCGTLVRDYRYTLLNKLTVAMVLL